MPKIPQIRIAYSNRTKPSERQCISSSQEAYKALMSSWDMNKIDLMEEVKLILLDRGSNCLGISDIATGGVSGCILDPKIVFSTALLAKASNLILAHNHPSGNLKPSLPDTHMTKKIALAAEGLDMTLLDHLIVTRHDYYSFADNRRLYKLAM